MLSRLKIGPKLLLAPAVVLLLLLMLSSGAYYVMLRQHQSLQTIVGPRAVQMRSATGMAAQAQRVHADTYKLLTWLGSSFSRARIEQLIGAVHGQHAAIERGLAVLERQTAAASLERRHVEHAALAYRRYVREVREVVELAHVDETIGANAMVKAEAAFGVLVQRMEMLAALERALSEEASSTAAAEFRVSATLMPVVALLAVAVSLAISMAVRRVLLDEIETIGTAAQGLAAGDLSIAPRVHGADEIGDTSRALEAGIRRLNGTLRTVAESARTIGSASRDITLRNLSMHSRAVFRTRSLEETAASMQQLASSVTVAATGTLAARGLAEQAAGSAREGGAMVEQMVEQMRATLDRVREGAARAAQAAATVDRLASEAGTLALDAAIDAAIEPDRARAHDDGRTAATLGALARQAADAAREVRALAERTVAEIEGCATRASVAEACIGDAAGSTRAMEAVLAELGGTSAGQAGSLAEVSRSMVRMDEVTRQNCALVEEAAAAARTLQMQALALSRTMAAFRLDEPEAPAPVSLPAASVPPHQKESGVPRDLPRERRRHERAHLRLAASRD
ncbi:MCP four helix bundle domain-containing protein [Massilia sp. MS-15]|uniref:MCP four helix bundle domain-containing protein n=1 Tax=Massilia sp. MS-15 TaxID=2878200 RepID=UPI001CD7AD8D|nr:MCP four helix bundle domain-containing protein [Massilia sp. MS-15]MCA1248272.1 MCP four helix bundle domain-containing protein [Massilia sp. MS-15]